MQNGINSQGVTRNLHGIAVDFKAVAKAVTIDDLEDAGKLLLAAALFRKAFNLAEEAEREAEKLANKVIEQMILEVQQNATP